MCPGSVVDAAIPVGVDSSPVLHAIAELAFVLLSATPLFCPGNKLTLPVEISGKGVGIRLDDRETSLLFSVLPLTFLNASSDVVFVASAPV